MYRKMLKQIFFLFLAVSVGSGVLPMSSVATHSHPGFAHTDDAVTKLQGTQSGNHDDPSTHKCVDGIVCTQTLALISSEASALNVKSRPVWFSFTCKRLFNRLCAPELSF